MTDSRIKKAAEQRIIVLENLHVKSYMYNEVNNASPTEISSQEIIIAYLK